MSLALWNHSSQAKEYCEWNHPSENHTQRNGLLINFASSQKPVGVWPRAGIQTVDKLCRPSGFSNVEEVIVTSEK